MEVIARINIDTPRGRDIVRKLEGERKTVKLEISLSDNIAQNLEDNVDMVFDKLANRLNAHYGTNYALK